MKRNPVIPGGYPHWIPAGYYRKKGWRAFLCQVNKALSRYTFKKARQYYAGVTCAPCKGQPKLVTVLLSKEI
jgi:hypothetical protein